VTNWPHAPSHRLTEQGAYIVSCGTYEKAHVLNTASRLNLLRDLFFDCVAEAGWVLHAWALLSNHYHFIASSPGAAPRTLQTAHSFRPRIEPARQPAGAKGMVPVLTHISRSRIRIWPA
jgi:hypothetical protein